MVIAASYTATIVLRSLRGFNVLYADVRTCAGLFRGYFFGFLFRASSNSLSRDLSKVATYTPGYNLYGQKLWKSDTLLE